MRFLRLSVLQLSVLVGLGGSDAAAAPPATDPVAVSPGSAAGARIAESCPTFSWGAAADARGYELVVYRLTEDGEEARPVLRQRIRGSALAWTPSLDRCLERGGRYAWSIRAVGLEGPSGWSAASLFEVAARPSEAELAAALSVVRSYLDAGGEATPASGEAGEGRPETASEAAEPDALGPDPSPSSFTPTPPQLSVDGGVAATFFMGDGSLLTGLDPANLSGPVPVSRGGTGATDAGAALASLGAAPATHLHAACTLGDAVGCYTGPAATRDVAVCASGLRFCQPGGTYGATCEGEVLPAPESCDDLDNDCNQSIDDGNSLVLCPLTANVVSTSCNGGKCAVVTCVPGWEDSDGKYDTGCEQNHQRTVFVTSTTYNGDLGGLAGADAKCAERAAAGSLLGIYKAWLSTSLASPAGGRLEHSPKPYLRVDGAVIANDWSDLIDGSLQNPIDRDESGQQVAASNPWTGTKWNGNPDDSDKDCSDWTSSSNAVTGRAGNTSSTQHDWTDHATLRNCDTLRRLYCFEQE